MKKLLIPTMMLLVSSLPLDAQDGAPVSGLDKSDMDLTVSPGTDFYEYAAGGWVKKHPLTAEYSRYAQFDALQEKNQEQIHSLIEELAAAPQQPGSLGQKIGSLYRLAMDSARRNREGWTPIRPMLERIAAVENKTELNLLNAELMRRGVPLYFYIYCASDIMNSSMNLVQINQGGLSMGDRDYYLNEDEATVKVREAYKQYVRSLFQLVGNEEAVAEKKMQAVWDIESRIAKASYSAVQQRNTAENYHKMTYAKFLTDYPGIDWGSLFLQLGYPAFREISVSQPEPILEVCRLVQELPLEELKAYAEFKLINDAANSLDDKFRATYFDFYGRTMSGAQQDRPRWKRAVGVVEGVLGEAVGRMYVEKYFPESSKQKMLALVKNLQDALAERIQQQDWMSDATKLRALEKLKAFYVKIGYPDKWMDYTGLQINDSLSFYDNLVQAAEFMHAYNVEKRVNKPVDRDEWLMTPQTINAYYNPTTNEICFPAGILQPPFFNPNADDACNYGAIGVVIGHEMTHGFDDQGSQFDKDGNMKNWWTEEDQAKFKEKTKAMADFFDKIEVLPGMYANGQLTVGENIADHGGLNVAFQALQKAMKVNPLGEKDGFTPEQRFFLSYGLIWANNIREEMLRQLNKVDPHSPGRWRVNGALPHIDAWYEAFGISKKDPLFVPKSERVEVW